MNIPFSKVHISGRELEYVEEVFKSGWLTTAGRALELEERFRGMVGAGYACAVNSCTAALHLSLEALGIGPGDRVLVPSMTFTGSAEVVRYLGGDPVLLDVDYGTRMVTPEIGLAQLERAEEMRQARQWVASFYVENLSGVGCVDLPEIKVPFEDHAWHLFCIVLKPKAPISRNHFIEKMAEAGIGTSVHYKPLYRMTYYRERYRLGPESFPNSERIWQGTVSLPIYPTLTEEELEYIVKIIRGLLC